jgi:hypothetical protein
MFCTIFTLFSSATLAQQPAGQNPPLAAKLFAGSAHVTAMIAKAKSERKPDQANFVQRRHVDDRTMRPNISRLKRNIRGSLRAMSTLWERPTAG